MNGTARTVTTNTPRVHRREILAGSAAALLATGGSTALGPTQTGGTPHPDAELLALAQSYFAGQAVIDGWSPEQTSEKALAEADGDLIATVNRMAEIPAATMGGIHAKARVALHSLGTAAPEGWDFDVRLAQTALRDLVREVLA